MKPTSSKTSLPVKILQIVFIPPGIFFTLMVILAFTTVPFWIWYGLGTKKAGIHRPPDYIVLMGGGGMPSKSALIRCWFTAKAANHFTRSKVIIALPGDTTDSLGPIQLMKKELMLRGVAPGRISFENSGTNTRSQALNVFKRISKADRPIINPGADKKNQTIHQPPAILITTSPEHLYRSVLAFQKAGFLKTDGIPAFEEDIEGDLSFNTKKLGGKKYLPDVGESITLRYRFWTQLQYEILILREWLALGYYRLAGWI